MVEGGVAPAGTEGGGLCVSGAEMGGVPDEPEDDILL